MKPILLLLGMLCLSAPAIPSFDQVDRISINTLRGWVLDIYPDGSGKLTYGSSAGDDAQIPVKTFSFQDVYNLIIPHVTRNYSVDKSVAVFLFVKGVPLTTPPDPLNLEDKATIKKIMSQARDKSVPLDQNRFKELLLKYLSEWNDTK